MRQFVVFVIFILFVAGSQASDLPSQNNKVVHIASIEREPYAGQQLPDRGMVNELITAAYAQVGVRAEIEFYPMARARVLLETGQVDAIAPIRILQQSSERDSSGEFDNLATQYRYSSVLPGAQQVLLKKKSTVLDMQTLSLPGAQPVRLSALRGTLSIPSELKKLNVVPVFVAEEFQQLGMLALDRVDLALMDKYTAADLMVTQRPDLIGQLDFLPISEQTNGYHLAFNPSLSYSEQALAWFEQGLDLLAESNQLRGILNKHGFFQRHLADGNKTELVIGAVDIYLAEQMQQLTDEFEAAHPHIKLTWRVLEENILRTRLMSDLAVDDGQFDVIMVGDYEAQTWAKNHWLVPIDIDANTPEFADVLPVVRDNLLKDNEIVALPLQSETSITFYRKDIFAALGLTMPDNPSYADIQRLAAQIIDRDGQRYAVGFRAKPGWGQNMAFFTTLVHSFGGKWFDDDYHPLLNTAPWHDALEYYIQMLQRYGPPDPENYGWRENLDLFAAGKLVMVVDATSAASRLFDPAEYSHPERIGYVSHPTQRTHIGSRWYWGWNLAIPTSSRNKPYAQQLAAWLGSADVNKRLLAKNPTPIGARYSSYELDFGVAQDYAQFVLKQLENDLPHAGRPAPTVGMQYVPIPEFPAIGQQVGLLIASAVRGDISADEALKRAQRQVEKIMLDAGYFERTK